MAAAVAASPFAARYGTAVDRESAYELLAKRAEEAATAAHEAEAAAQAQKQAADEAAAQAKLDAAAAKARAQEAAREAKARDAATRRTKSEAESILTSVLRSAGTQIGREITRSIFGTRRR